MYANKSIKTKQGYDFHNRAPVTIFSETTLSSVVVSKMEKTISPILSTLSDVSNVQVPDDIIQDYLR